MTGAGCITNFKLPGKKMDMERLHLRLRELMGDRYQAVSRDINGQWYVIHSGEQPTEEVMKKARRCFPIDIPNRLIQFQKL